jgi:hypothetical protein
MSPVAQRSVDNEQVVVESGLISQHEAGVLGGL